MKGGARSLDVGLFDAVVALEQPPATAFLLPAQHPAVRPKCREGRDCSDRAAGQRPSARPGQAFQGQAQPGHSQPARLVSRPALTTVRSCILVAVTADRREVPHPSPKS